MFFVAKKLQKLKQQTHSCNFIRKTFCQSKSALKESTNFKDLFKILKPEKKLFLKGTLLTVATSCILMLFPKALKGLSDLSNLKFEQIDQNDTPEQIEEKQLHNSKINEDYIKYLAQWSFLFALSGYITYKRRYICIDISYKISCRMRKKIYSNLLKKDIQFYSQENVSVAQLSHKLSNDVTAISNSLSLDLIFGLRGVLFIIGGSAYLIYFIPEWTLISVGIMGLLSLTTKKLGAMLQVAKSHETDILNHTSVIANEKLQMIKLIKISNTEELERFNYYKQLQKFYEKSKEVSYLTGISNGFLDGMGQLSLISILVYGSYLVSSGVGDPSMLTSSMYTLYIGLGFRSVINTYNELKKVNGLYDGLKPILQDIDVDAEFNQDELSFESGYEQPIKQKLDCVLEKPPAIIFQNISFKYRDTDTKILEKFNMNIAPGEIIALIGSSGSGKSTVLNLLTKLYNPQEGKILIDQKNLNDLDINWVQKNISYVTQDHYLMMGTVYDNIIYGNQGFDISEQNVIKAAKLSNAHEFIEKMPNRYNTILYEKGNNLSGGQRQRLIIARALLKDPRIIILDEPTSNIDSSAEQLIIEELKQICKQRTCIIVTHKLDHFNKLVNSVIDINR